jgi:hypothetical protein
MKGLRRVMTFVVLNLLGPESVTLLAPVSASAEGPPPAAGKLGAPPPHVASARLLAALRSKVPIEPLAVKEDPYLVWHGKDPPRAPASTVCGVRFEPDRVHYRTTTFTTSAAARNAGFAVTHFGACGTCSTLQDLAVYLEKPDLTAPVRSCGMKPEASASLTCLEELGFSTACAQTWRYNIENTRRQCFSLCMTSWIKGEAPTRKDGRLNECLQCDEDRSGPVFKATAGRTRRNSGIQSSIPRPNDEIAPVVHDYVPDLAPR